MFEDIPDYIKETIAKVSEGEVLKEKFELYQLEARVLEKIKREFESCFEDAVKSNISTSIRKDENNEIF